MTTPRPDEPAPHLGPVLERELKLNVATDFTLPDLSVQGFSAVAAAHRYLEAVYYDTDDLRLVRWGCSLRHRTGDGWTVKLPPSGSAELIERREVRFEGRWDEIPAPALELVRAFIRRAPLRQVARLRTVRKPIVLLDAGGRPVAEVVEDRVSANHRPGPAECFCEVEVELAKGSDPALLEPLLDRLRGAGAGGPSAVTKLKRALGSPARRAPDVVVPDLDGDPSTGLVVQAAIAASVVRFITNLPGVHLDEEPESLHQVRVATRRLRSDLRTFLPLLEPAWAEPLRDHLRWLGDALGLVRDTDVLLARLRVTSRLLPDPDAAAGLLDTLMADRKTSRDALLAALREERYGLVLDELVSAAARPVLLAGAEGPARGALVGLIAGPLQRLRTTVAGLSPSPGDSELHRVRIWAKRVRYAAEAVAPVLGKKAARLGRVAARLQDTLGELQDASVAYSWLSGAAERDPGTGFTAGRLAGIELMRAADSRRGWPLVWERFVARTPKGWT